MKQKRSGIYKGVSEAVYPNDLLGDQELQGADLATRGAWCSKVLPVMWRDREKGGRITDTIPGFAQFWGCDVTEAERIVTVIEARKVGNVSRDCHGNVTLECRRLSRRHKVMEDARLRKQRERERAPGHAIVTHEKTSPSSSSSSSSSNAGVSRAPEVAEVTLPGDLEQLAFQAYGNTPLALAEAVGLHGADIVKRAILATNTAGKRSWAYTNGILQGWAREGVPEAQKAVAHPPAAFAVPKFIPETYEP